MSNDLVWHNQKISKEQRATLKAQKPVVLWFTGLSGSGKSTLANRVEEMLYELNKHTYLLDGDNVRIGLNKDLGFSDEDRVENIRRIGELCKLFVDAGLIVLSAFISPFAKDRAMVRELVEKGEFIEVFVDTPLEVCASRDPKGMYAKAKAGKIKNFTGISSPYEAPINPEIRVETQKMSVDESAEMIINFLKKEGYLC